MDNIVGPTGLKWLSAAGALSKATALKDLLNEQEAITSASEGVSLAAVPVLMSDLSTGTITLAELAAAVAAINAE